MPPLSVDPIEDSFHRGRMTAAQAAAARLAARGTSAAKVKAGAAADAARDAQFQREMSAGGTQIDPTTADRARRNHATLDQVGNADRSAIPAAVAGASDAVFGSVAPAIDAGDARYTNRGKGGLQYLSTLFGGAPPENPAPFSESASQIGDTIQQRGNETLGVDTSDPNVDLGQAITRLIAGTLTPVPIGHEMAREGGPEIPPSVLDRQPLDGSILPPNTALQDHRTAQMARKIAAEQGWDISSIGRQRAGDDLRLQNVDARLGKEPDITPYELGNDSGVSEPPAPTQSIASMNVTRPADEPIPPSTLRQRGMRGRSGPVEQAETRGSSNGTPVPDDGLWYYDNIDHALTQWPGEKISANQLISHLDKHKGLEEAGELGLLDVTPGEVDEKATKKMRDKDPRAGEAKRPDTYAPSQWLKDHTDAKGNVSKADLQQFMDQNRIQVNEVWKGNDAEIAKEIAKKWSVRPNAEESTYAGEDRFDVVDENGRVWTTTDRADAEDYIRDVSYEMVRDRRQPTQFGPDTRPDLNLPGGENYRELLLTKPVTTTKEKMYKAHLEYNGRQEWHSDRVTEDQINELRKVHGDALHIDGTYDEEHPMNGGLATFRGSHWKEPNVLAHVRMDDRILPNPAIDRTPEQLSDIGRRLTEAVGAKEESHLGSGSIDIGLRKGIITPEEAAAYAKSKGFRIDHLKDLPPTTIKKLHIAEVQSDWHQKGRKNGYFDQAAADKARADSEVADKAQNEFHQQMIDKYELPNDTSYKMLYHEIHDRLNASNTTTTTGLELWKESQQYHRLEEAATGARNTYNKAFNGVANGPFKGAGWKKLAMKRILKYAADNGYEGITWTTGAQQAERYKLSRHVNSINWNKINVGHPDAPSGVHSIRIETPDADHYISVDGEGKVMPINGNGYAPQSEWIGRRLDDIVGKDVADKILSADKGELSGDGLNVGGEGMKGAYDRELPNIVNDLMKKHGEGNRVGKLSLPTRPNIEIRKAPHPNSELNGGAHYYRVYENGEHVNTQTSMKDAEDWVADNYPLDPMHGTHHVAIPPSLKSSKLPLFAVAGAAAALGAAKSAQPDATPDDDPIAESFHRGRSSVRIRPHH